VSLRLAVDGRELRPGVRPGIRRYTLEVLRAAVARGLDCVVYGDAATALDAIPRGACPVVLDHRFTQWWDQVALPAALARDGAGAFLSPVISWRRRAWRGGRRSAPTSPRRRAS
jgi:hypothetical protein